MYLKPRKAKGEELVNKTVLGSAEDMYSCLVPCFGFENVVEGAAYEYEGAGDSYAPVLNRLRVYVPRITVDGCNSSTNGLLPAEQWVAIYKPRFERLRRKSDPKPASAYNVALLVGGKRQYCRHAHTRNRNPWFASLVSGRRECYVVWGRGDVSMLHPSSRISGTPLSPIYASRSGLGVIYAEEYNYNPDGSIKGDQARYAAFEFAIFDRDPQKDSDVLKIEVHHAGTAPVLGNELEDEPRWRPLWVAAREGFARECNPQPDEVTNWWRDFKHQLNREAADRAIMDGSSFFDQVAKLHWQDALRLVKEPWQLNAVVHHHGAKPEFSSDGGVYCIHYETVPTMISRHDCDEARKAELMKMMEFFVEPTDSLWNHRGD